jgi:hypothetical protein
MTGSLDEEAKSPRSKFTVLQGGGNQVERMANGNFMVFWKGKPVYQNGRIRRFVTADDAVAFITRCDEAGKILR